MSIGTQTLDLSVRSSRRAGCAGLWKIVWKERKEVFCLWTYEQWATVADANFFSETTPELGHAPETRRAMRLSSSHVTWMREKKIRFAASVYVEIAEVTFHDEMLFCRKDVYLRVLTPLADKLSLYLSINIYIYIYIYIYIQIYIYTYQRSSSIVMETCWNFSSDSHAIECRLKAQPSSMKFDTSLCRPNGKAFLSAGQSAGSEKSQP